MQDGLVVIDQMTCSTSKYCFIRRQRLFDEFVGQARYCWFIISVIA